MYTDVYSCTVHTVPGLPGLQHNPHGAARLRSFKTRLLHSQPRNWVAKCKAGWIGEVNETLLLFGQAS